MTPTIKTRSRANIDLFAVFVWTILTVLVLAVGGAVPDAFRLLFGLPFVLFLPGYVIVAALFPEGAANSVLRADKTNPLSGPERVALSVLVSVAVVVAVGFVADLSGVGFSLWPLLVGLLGVTVSGLGLALVRRRRLPDHRSFGIGISGRQLRQVLVPSSTLQLGLNVVLALSLLFAGAAVAHHATVDRTQHTETYLLAENESGEFVADDYPTDVAVDESRSLVFGLENNEGRQMEHTVVVKLQGIESTDGTTEVVGERRIDTFSLESADGETVRRPHTVTFTQLADRHRLVYLVYEGSPPEDPSMANADEELHLWVTVSEDESSSDTTASAEAAGPTGGDA